MTPTTTLPSYLQTIQTSQTVLMDLQYLKEIVKIFSLGLGLLFIDYRMYCPSEKKKLMKFWRIPKYRFFLQIEDWEICISNHARFFG